MGTPHAGSGFAQRAEKLARFIGLVKQTDTEILRVLKSDSEVLARIKDDFHNMIRRRISEQQPEIRITCCYEELPIFGEHEVSESQATCPHKGDSPQVLPKSSLSYSDLGIALKRTSNRLSLM